MKTKKTFIVLGCPRSGTSMIAGLLRILGIDMGDKIKPDKHEDLDILWKDIEEVRERIRDYNSRKEVWGFKDPNFADKIFHLRDEFINPQYLVIFRDAAKAIESDIRRNPNMRRATAEKRNNRHIFKINTLIDELEDNYVIFNYEDFIKNPIDNIKRLMKFIGTNEKELKTCETFIKHRDYTAI